jgi:hypothetical protein
VKNACRILVKKSDGKRPLGRSTHRREDNIKMNLWEIVPKMWIGYIWFRILTTGRFSEHGNEPLGSVKVREFLD